MKLIKNDYRQYTAYRISTFQFCTWLLSLYPRPLSIARVGLGYWLFVQTMTLSKVKPILWPFFKVIIITKHEGFTPLNIGQHVRGMNYFTIWCEIWHHLVSYRKKTIKTLLKPGRGRITPRWNKIAYSGKPTPLHVNNHLRTVKFGYVYTLLNFVMTPFLLEFGKMTISGW